MVYRNPRPYNPFAGGVGDFSRISPGRKGGPVVASTGGAIPSMPERYYDHNARGGRGAWVGEKAPKSAPPALPGGLFPHQEQARRDEAEEALRRQQAGEASEREQEQRRREQAAAEERLRNPQQPPAPVDHWGRMEDRTQGRLDELNRQYGPAPWSDPDPAKAQEKLQAWKDAQQAAKDARNPFKPQNPFTTPVTKPWVDPALRNIRPVDAKGKPRPLPGTAVDKFYESKAPQDWLNPMDRNARQRWVQEEFPEMSPRNQRQFGRMIDSRNRKQLRSDKQLSQPRQAWNKGLRDRLITQAGMQGTGYQSLPPQARRQVYQQQRRYLGVSRSFQNQSQQLSRMRNRMPPQMYQQYANRLLGGFRNALYGTLGDAGLEKGYIPEALLKEAGFSTTVINNFNKSIRRRGGSRQQAR